MAYSVDPKEFWENKILHWENGRYDAVAENGPLLERLADRASNSLRFRLAITTELLLPHVEGKRVVEIGCGSGLITKAFIDGGAASYHGYDISERAIKNASDLAKQNGTEEKSTYTLCSVGDLPNLEADIVFSLGLLDWLDDVDLDKIFKVSGSADYLHAIAEKQFSIQQYIHRAYVHMSYGWRTQGYVPRYYKVDEIADFAHQYNSKSVHVYRDPRLSFGALVSTLPISEAK